MACDVAPLAMFCFLRHHCHQWFFNGFGIRQSLVTIVFDGCAPWDQYSFDTTERKEASIYLACKGNSQEKSCFWKPPKYGSTGFLSPSTQCVGSNTWHLVCQGSSTEWRILSTVKNLQPYMYPVDTHMWLAEAKTFCFLWKKFSCIKIDGT